jgi:predicted patatin/cPLA2 family phospholipase
MKIGIVATGGGLRCAYSAGALLALAEKYGLKEPYALGAESGSAGNALYYLAKQYSLVRKVWNNYIADPKFVNRTGLHVDYLIDTIFKKKAPLDIRALEVSKTKYFISIANAITGDTEFVTNKSFFDYYETLRAAKALPIVYGKRVRLGLKTYIDGSMTSDIDSLAKKVLSTGVTTLITINCEPARRDSVSKIFLSAKALVSRRGLRLAMLKDLAVPPGLCPIGVKARAYCLCPSKPLRVGTMTGDQEAITEAFNLGYADIVNSKELQRLFAKKHGKISRRK